MTNKSDSKPHNTDGKSYSSVDGWQESLVTRTRTGTQGSPGIIDIRVPGFTILWHTNPNRIGEICALSRLPDEPIEISRLAPFFCAPFGEKQRPLADPHMSRQPIKFHMQKDGSIQIDVNGSSTRVSINGIPLETTRSIQQSELEKGVVLLLAKRIALLFHLLEPPVMGMAANMPSLGLVGWSSAIVKVKREIVRVADLSSPVLLSGESGTGKELVARGIHNVGARRDKPYFSINMGAIPPNLAASELFGAKRGAYSGADKNRLGFFQRADTGTLFLDEIGETSPETQALLLRALDSGEVQQVGAEIPRKVDVRVIAATDMNLEQSRKRGEFKTPLFYRLAGSEISLPPLRDRIEDLGRLLLHFINEQLSESNRGALKDPGPHGKSWLPASFVANLAMHDWPGNVRQLKNVVRKLVVSSFGIGEPQIDFELERFLSGAKDTKSDADTGVTRSQSTSHVKDTGYRHPWDVSEDELVRVLKECRFNLKQAADVLGVSRPSLYNLVDACKRVRKAADLNADEIEQCLKRQDGNLQAAADELEVSRRALKMRMKELKIA